MDVTEAAEQNQLYVHMASNRFSVGGDNTNPLGVALANMSRQMEIGGLVFDWGFEKRFHLRFPPGGESDIKTAGVYVETSVLTDRFDMVGNPASLSNNAPLVSTTPVTLSTVGGGGNPPELEMPTRIHWRRTEYVNPAPVVLDWSALGINDGQATAVPGTLRVYDQRRTESLRLRLRLLDEQGLFFRIALRATADFPDGELAFRWWAAGSIFYRVRF